jgi:hypothetical protein
MARHAAGHRVDRELHRDTPLLQLIVELPHLVLRLSDGHAVAGNDYDEVRLLQHLSAPLDRFFLVDLLISTGLGLLCLPESAEEHVQERTVHRPAHDDRQDEATGPIQSTGGDQELVVEHEPHRHRRQTGI